MQALKTVLITLFTLSVLTFMAIHWWIDDQVIDSLRTAVFGSDASLDEKADHQRYPEKNSEPADNGEASEKENNKDEDENDKWTPLSSFQEEEKVRQKALKIIEGSESRQKALEKIYDWVTQNISYDVDKRGESYYLDAAQTLQTREGVCGDYAHLTKQMLLSIGIEAEMKKGEAAMADGTTELHAWNHARAGGEKYALDTTWGAGYINEKDEFIRRPVPLFFTTPEELDRLHRDPEYTSQMRKEYLVDQALRQSPRIASSYEESIHAELALSHRDDLQREARTEAGRISDKVLENWEQVFIEGAPLDKSWSSSPEELFDRLDDQSNLRTLNAMMFTFWSYPPPPEEEITREVVQVIKKESQAFSHAGVAVKERLDLVVVYVLLAEVEG